MTESLKLKNSKFANLIKTFDDGEIIDIFEYLNFSPGTKEAIKMMDRSTTNEIQMIALDNEYKKRFEQKK